MICPTCKSNISDESVLCPVCGKPVSQDHPDIHSEEKVELPKRDEEPPVVRSNDDPHQAQPSPSGEPVATRQMPVNEKRTELTGQEMPHRANRPSPDAAMPEGRYHHDPSGRGPSRQYRNLPPHNPGARRPAPGSSGMSGMSVRPLSEKEEVQLRHGISIKSILAFIFSIFGLSSIVMDLPCGIVGLVLSIIVRNEYRNRGWQKDTDLKLADAAFVCSIIGIVLGVIGLIVMMFTGAGVVAGLSALASLGSGGSSYYGF